MVRIGMKGALAMAGIGPWAAQWMGWIAFMMGSSGALSDTYTILWGILYVCVNIGLMALQWHIGPGVMNWIINAPLGSAEEVLEDAEEEGEEGVEDIDSL